MKNNILFVLIPGFNSNKNVWGKKFLSKLEKIGDIYTYSPIFYKKTKFSENDLTLKNHCEQLYKNITLKNNQKIILISHSIGSYFAYQFAKLYKKDVILSIMLDPAFMGIVGKERLGDTRFLEFDKEIKENKYTIEKLIKDKKFDILNKIVRHLLIKQVPYNIKKFPTPTIYFRNLEFDNDQGYTMKDRAIREGLFFKDNDKKFKIYWFINDTHYLFKKNNVLEQIIIEIKSFINML
jgi:pimeloyl-ACP methyl ester carboxylesterase